MSTLQNDIINENLKEYILEADIEELINYYKKIIINSSKYSWSQIYKQTNKKCYGCVDCFSCTSCYGCSDCWECYNCSLCYNIREKSKYMVCNVQLTKDEYFEKIKPFKKFEKNTEPLLRIHLELMMNL